MTTPPRTHMAAVVCTLAVLMLGDQLPEANAVALPEGSTTSSTAMVLADELEDAVAAGWSNDEISDAGESGNVHGPWGFVDSNASITFEVPATTRGFTNVCTISLRAWAIGEWSLAWFEVYANGALVWDKQSAGSKGCLRTGWTIGPTDFPGHEAHHPSCYYDVDVDVTCDEPELTIGISATVDRAEEHESWAFQHFQLVVAPKELMCAEPGVVDCDEDTILIDDADAVKLPRKEKNYQKICCVIDPANTCADVECDAGTKQVEAADTVQRPLKENRRQRVCCVVKTCADATCDVLSKHIDDADAVELPSNPNRVQPICCVRDATCADAVCAEGTTHIDDADTVDLPRKERNHQRKCCVPKKCADFECKDGTVQIDAADTVDLPSNANRRQTKCCAIDPENSCATVDCAEGTSLIDGAEAVELPKKEKRYQDKCCE